MSSTNPDSGSRILLIDNDVDVAEVVAAFLRRRGGYDVIHAEDGKRGLAELASLRHSPRDVELVLLDLRMPGMGGVEVLGRLEELDHSPKVLVLSGFVDADDAARLEASPLVHAILKKPFDLLGLLAAVEAALASGEGGAGRVSAGPSAAELPWGPPPREE